MRIFKRRKKEPVVLRVIASVFGIATVALAIKAIPDIRRYMRIETM